MIELPTPAPETRASGNRQRVNSSSDEAILRELTILNLRLDGATIADIATHLGLDVQTVWRLMRSPAYRTLAADTVESALLHVKERFILRAEAHAKNIDHLAFHSDKDSVRLAASQDVLDRADATNSKPKGGEGGVNVTINLADVKLIAETAQQLGTATIRALQVEEIEDGSLGEHPTWQDAAQAMQFIRDSVGSGDL